MRQISWKLRKCEIKNSSKSAWQSFWNFGSKCDSATTSQQLYSRFSSNPRWKTVLLLQPRMRIYLCMPFIYAHTHVIPCIACEKAKFFLTSCLWTFLSYFKCPRCKHMFESTLKLSLCTPKWFNAFQVLNLFSFLLRVTCIIFARVTNTDACQAIITACTIDICQAKIACTTESQKTVVSHLNCTWF